MKPLLTVKQMEVYRAICEDFERTYQRPVLAHGYWKESWKQRGQVEGHPRQVIDALEKKGYITVDHKDVGREVGIFNPVADSWGYSAYYCNIYVVPTLEDAA